MDKQKLINWESIKPSTWKVFSPRESTRRARIPNGWLVRYEYFGGEGKSASAIVYVPDTDGEWNLEEQDGWKIVHHRRSPNDDNIIARLKVPGGWIVRDGYYVKSKHLSLDLVFVPDPDNDWVKPGKEGNDEFASKDQ